MNNMEKVLFVDIEKSIVEFDDEKIELTFNISNYIKSLNRANIKIIALYNINDTSKNFNIYEKQIEKIYDLFKSFKMNIDTFFYSFNDDEYNSFPNSGMIETAIETYKLKNYKKYLLSTNVSAIEAGNSVNLETILLNKLIKKPEINTMLQTPDKIFKYFSDAIFYIINEYEKIYD